MNMQDIEIISSQRFEDSAVEHSACVRAGAWVFLNGIEATDYRSGLDAHVKGHRELPLHGLPKHRRKSPRGAPKVPAACEHVRAPAGRICLRARLSES
jgi:hypothetical protein